MIRQIKIGNRMVGDNHPPFVIAEVGINHNGNLKTAMRNYPKTSLLAI